MKRRKSLSDDGAESQEDPTPKKTRSVQSGPIHQRNGSKIQRRRRDHAAYGEDASIREPDTREDEANPSISRGTQGVTPTKSILNNTHTPIRSSLGKKLFSTPKAAGISSSNGTPQIQRNANRSARKKSNRSLMERAILGYASEDDDEHDLANEIYGTGEDEEPIGSDDEVERDPAPDTPSKRKRGRPKGGKNKERSASPIAHDLPAHEKYFVQNRPGRVKTSNNTLASLKLLDHEEYFTLSRDMDDRHTKEIVELAAQHQKCFNQWQFELSQQFNLCIYGWGSKRSLLMKFAEHLFHSHADRSKAKIVVVNGYVPALTIRDIFNTIASTVSEPGIKLGSQPAEMLEKLLSMIEENPSQEVTLLIHSIDRMPLRRNAIQTLLSQLSAHPQIHLVVSADHPSFPLLWDGSLRAAYNFLFHECTTFKQYSAEVDVVDEVHELLGRSGRRVGGKDGVIFVLKSLPVNATNLFKILIGEQLATMSDNLVQANDDEDDEDEARDDRSRRIEEGIEYRTLYQKAVEEFICSNDMGFRSLLKEFHDHQMIQTKKDLLGVEYLVVPFRKEELESILEDISG